MTLIKPKARKLLAGAALILAAPAMIVPRTVVYYEGVWDGPACYAGRVLAEERGGEYRWHDAHSLLDGEWDGQAATIFAMLKATHLIGFAAGGRTIIPGSQTYTASGSSVITDFNQREVVTWGGGAGGGGANSGAGSANGTTGNASSYVSSTPVAANGGTGGRLSDGGVNGSTAAGGTASGGDTNTTGGTGAAGTTSSGAGGTAPSGTGTLLGTLTGGASPAGRGTNGNGAAGNAPGSGGAGAKEGTSDAGGGGSGGFALKLWSGGPGVSGAPNVGDTVTVTVGGAANGGGGGGGQSGGAGARGEIREQWAA